MRRESRAKLCIFLSLINYTKDQLFLENRLPRDIYMKITIIISTRLFIIFPNLITKESYNWWIIMRKWEFRHQISEAKCQKMSVANIWKHSGEFRRRTKWLRNFADEQDGCEIGLQLGVICFQWL